VCCAVIIYFRSQVLRRRPLYQLHVHVRARQHRLSVRLLSATPIAGCDAVVVIGGGQNARPRVCELPTRLLHFIIIIIIITVSSDGAYVRGIAPLNMLTTFLQKKLVFALFVKMVYESLMEQLLQAVYAADSSITYTSSGQCQQWVLGISYR